MQGIKNRAFEGEQNLGLINKIWTVTLSNQQLKDFTFSKDKDKKEKKGNSGDNAAFRVKAVG